MNPVSFLSYWVTNSLFLYLAFLVFPNIIVLGNNVRSPTVAALASGLLLTIIIGLVPYVAKKANLKIKKESQLGMVYFVVNVLGIWLIARGATVIGFGITAFWVAIILGFIVNLLQWGVWKATAKKS